MGERPDLEPTGDPTAPGRRPYTVHVSEAIEYQGWVLATGVDDADDQARRLLDDGGSATGRGHLDIVGFDREVIANDAAEVCWQCRSDPRHPNPACPHPPPAKEQPPVAATEHTRIDPIRRVLDLSTAHLPEHLGSHGLSGEDGVTAYDLDGYGWLMWIPPDPDSHAADYPGLPAEVLTIQRYARQRGCDYVLLDQDADIIDGLPTWDW